LWATENKVSLEMMAHMMAMQFLRCKEQSHESEIQNLKAAKALLYDTLAEYVKRFGKIQLVDNNKSKPQRNERPLE
jgi:hypothetical protein